MTFAINIGKTLEKRLSQIEISSLSDLKKTGSKNAFIKIKTLDPAACVNILFALEGAIQEKRWHNLKKIEKDELNEFYKMLEKQK